MVVDALPASKKQILSLIGKLKCDKDKPHILSGDKYLQLDPAKKYTDGFQEGVHVPLVPIRPAFITSSIGTTIGGIVKGCVSAKERCQISFGKEISDSLLFRVHSGTISYKLTGSGKRDIRALIDEGVSKVVRI